MYVPVCPRAKKAREEVLALRRIRAGEKTAVMVMRLWRKKKGAAKLQVKLMSSICFYRCRLGVA